MVHLRQQLMRRRVQKVTRNNPHLADALERNIETILALRREAEASKGLQDRLADNITGFAGSMGFLYAHVIWFGLWLVVNTGLVSAIRPFDPYPFSFLTLVVSLEAIFLSTLVMVSQNRASSEADDRADLDLQIDLLGEYEITRMLHIVTSIGKRLGVEGCEDAELLQLEKTVMPDELLKEITDKKKEVQK